MEMVSVCEFHSVTDRCAKVGLDCCGRREVGESADIVRNQLFKNSSSAARLLPCAVRGLFPRMSTLQEIETDMETLPRREQEVLLHHLSTKLRKPGVASAHWPVPPPDVSPEEIRRVQALIDEEFSHPGDGE